MPATTADTTSESTSVSPSSARPGEVVLDGKDPCQLVTDEQLTVMQFKGPGRTGTDSTYKSPYCSWTATGQSIQLIPVTTEGIEEWASGKRRGQPTQADPVEGFPAITVTLPDDPNQCDLFVDTAEGQYLSATYSVSPSFKDRFPKPCEGARKLAEAAMQNLVK
ncbi:DUF3558 domain-containing protein [Saccharothrix sp. 6-C]|nr:DUF3558 domain-containing protein [Saccharothrix sp. 6-C]